MLNALDITKFVTLACTAVIDVMDKILEPQEIFQKIDLGLQQLCEAGELMYICIKCNN